MNGDANPLGGDGDLGSKFNFLMENLLKNKKEEKPDVTALKSLKDSLFPEEKDDKQRMRRLKQKQRVLQAVPIAIDSITSDGQKDIKRTLKDIFTFKMDTVKPDIKKGPWAALFGLLALVIGFLIGAVKGFFEQFKLLFTKIKGFITGLGKLIAESKIGKAIAGIFKAIKLKLVKGLEVLKNTKIGKLVTSFFATIKTKVGSFFNKIKGVFSGIAKFFAPLLDFTSKLKVGAVLKGPFSIITKIIGFFKSLAPFFEVGLKAGRLFGKVLFPIFLIIDVISGFYKSFTDPKLKDKSFLQKAITGFISGILGFFDIFSIFGLEFFNYNEIRDRIEKIFKPFREGKWIQGIGQIVNQIVSWVMAIPGKILGWIVGWFNKDLGAKITEYFRNFDLFDQIKNIVGTIVGWFKKIYGFFEGIVLSVKNAYDKIKGFATNLYDKIVGFVKGVIETITGIFDISKIKDWIKGKLGFGPTEREVTVKEVGDFASTRDRTLFTGRDAYKFDQDDEIVALKEGGPIEKLLKDRDDKSSRSIDNLNRTVEELSKTFEKYANTTMQIHQNEQKLMLQNIELLKRIGDNEKSSNVVVQNSSNNMVLQEKASSNQDFRKDMTWLSRY